MGGRVGLKGTDGVLEEALRRGARPFSWEMGRRFLLSLEKLGVRDAEFVVPEGDMGEKCFEGLNFKYERIEGNFRYPNTSPEDTKNCVKEMISRGCSIIVFVGGDGTARDVASSADEIPILGIPAGVKMYSSVFAETPEEGAYVLSEFLRRREVILGEILDIDEEAFRRDVLNIRLYAYHPTPRSEFLQSSKSLSHGEEDKKAIAEYFYEELFDPNSSYVLGPGTTVLEIKKKVLGRGTVLGVDLYVKGEGYFDVWEKQILELLSPPAKIVVSPIGGQGFIFGRGNQQISPKVIRKVGVENVIVVSSKDKLLRIDSLKVYTGDPEVDLSFPDYIRVLTGYREWKLMPVKKPKV